MRRIVALLLVCAGIAACQRPAPPAEPADSAVREDPAAASSTQAAPTPDDLPDTSAVNEGGAAKVAQAATTRYTCDGGHGVAVTGESARITLADGRVVEIRRVAQSSPPRYSGEALSFDVSDEGGMLGQHETGGFACREAE